MAIPFSDNPLPYNTMTLTGQGQVTTIPNTAIIRLGVQTNGLNLMETQAENAKISQSILKALKQIGYLDIATYQYNIDKLFDYENGNRIDRGFTVRNIFQIETNNMDQIGMIIDTAVNSGANVVDFISFEVSDPEMYYQQALNMAIMQAHQKAKSIAMRLGLPMDPVPIRIVENSSLPVPYSENFAVRDRTMATPIEPGHKRIEAHVTVDFAY